MTLVDVEIGTVAQRVAVVTINDPDRRNALTPAMNAELIATMDRLEGDAGVGAVVITGTPPAFCAGADLSHLGASPTPEGLRGIYEGFLRVARSPLPTVAAVNGAAVGAGMNMALCCDLRVAAKRARFDTRFLQLGLHPGGGHTWMIQRIMGPQGAAAAVLFGEVIDGEAAERSGLVWRCVDDADLLDTAAALAGRAAAGPPSLARRVKATLGAVAAVDTHEEAIDVELEAQVWSMAQPEFAERLAALQKKITTR
ncbi:MAG: enoyl-CoA hydratase [Acidimicrobiales bacterium]